MVNQSMASKKYVKDYDIVETEDSKGRIRKSAVYRGNYFHVELEESQLKQFKVQCLVLFFLALAMHVVAGVLNNIEALRVMYIAIPYTATFIPMLFLGEAIFRLPNEKRPFQNEEIGRSFRQVINLSRLTIIFELIGLLGGLIHQIFVAKGQNLGAEALYYGLILIAAGLNWLILSRTKAIGIREEILEIAPEDASNEEADSIKSE